MKTLYAVLGVDPSADQTDLEVAFMRLKVRYPQAKLDADENARIQFQGIQQAFNTLNNPESRALYDKRLAKAGIRTASASGSGADDPAGWLSTRNIIVVGVVALLIAGMWFYHSQEQTRMQKEILERTLRLAEEEKKREADARDAEEARRQAQQAFSQQRQDEMRERQLRNEAAQSLREAQSQSRMAESQAAMLARQQQNEQMARERADQAAKQRATYEAERRLQNDKQNLRAMCMQRYNRPDC